MRRNVRRSMEMRFLKRLPTAAVLLTVIIISLAVGYVWIQWVLPYVARSSPLGTEQWAMLEALSSAATLALAVGAGIMLFIELTETSDSRNLDIYRDIYEKLMSDEETQARRYIYQKIPASEDAQVMIGAVLDDEQARRYVKRVLNTIDYFGFLVEQDWVTADEVIGWISPIVAKVWTKIGPVVEYECAQRPEEPDYYEAAIKLAERCQKWRDRNLPDRQRVISFEEGRL